MEVFTGSKWAPEFSYSSIAFLSACCASFLVNPPTRSILFLFPSTLTIVLILAGFTIYFAFGDKENGIIFFITYMALFQSIAGSINIELQAAKIRKTKLVTGYSIRNLEKELNEEIKGMKKKNYY